MWYLLFWNHKNLGAGEKPHREKRPEEDFKLLWSKEGLKRIVLSRYGKVNRVFGRFVGLLPACPEMKKGPIIGSGLSREELQL
jgi:hypothetical protein